MDKFMPYLIAIVATYAAVQSWKRAHGIAAPGIMGNGQPCGACQSNPHAHAGCCGH